MGFPEFQVICLDSELPSPASESAPPSDYTCHTRSPTHRQCPSPSYPLPPRRHPPPAPRHRPPSPAHISPTCTPQRTTAAAAPAGSTRNPPLFVTLDRAPNNITSILWPWPSIISSTIVHTPSVLPLLTASTTPIPASLFLSPPFIPPSLRPRDHATKHDRITRLHRGETRQLIFASPVIIPFVDHLGRALEGVPRQGCFDVQ